MTCQLLCTFINFDSGDDSRIGDDFNEESAVFFPLADRLVVKDRATYAFTQTGRGHNQLPI